MKARSKNYVERALQCGTADAAFACIVKGQRDAYKMQDQRKKWSNEKKSARRKGKL